MTPEPTLTDEELAEIEGVMLGPGLQAYFGRRLIAALRASRAEITQSRQDSNANYLRAEEYDQALVAARGQIDRMKVALVKAGITEW